MFSKSTKAPEAAEAPRVSGFASLIAEGVTIKGDLATPGDLHLDGAVEGDLRAGRLTLGESGSVTGAIHADSIEVRGRVTGTIAARVVRLCASARVDGDITHAELAVEAGAHFEGRSQMFAAEPALSVAAE